MVRKPFRIGEVIRAKHIGHFRYIVVSVGYDDKNCEPTYGVKVVGVKKNEQWLLDISDTIYQPCLHRLFVRVPRNCER